MLQPIFELNDRVSLSLPWPLQILHYALTIGSIIRMNVHIYMSLAVDLDPALADRDISLKSPCLELREHPKHDLTARFISMGVALIIISMYGQLSGPYTSLADWVVVAFGAANIAVPLFDPLWWLLDRL